jgi:LPS-assembly lipoprotein
MKARLILICLLLLTTACGFHLRGSQTANIDIDNIYINPSSAPRLAKQVISQLGGAGVIVAKSSAEATYIVTLKEERFDRNVLSVSASTGKVEEFQIIYNAKFDAAHPDGRNIINNATVRVSRDITFDENAVLGKFSEEVVIQEDLIRSASSKVLRRLQAKLPASN